MLVKRTLEWIRERQLSGVMVTVLSVSPKDYPENRIGITKKLVKELEGSGMRVILISDLHEHFTVIDQAVIWYGSLNI